MSDATSLHSRPRRDAGNLSAVPYLPGLDGLRAVAVVAVMVYHANPAWLHGGFLGVEVFFVISGYLITLLLMAEREQTGAIDLVGFWGRRARRLLPALYLMMFLVLSYSALFKASVLGKLRGDLIASLAYVMNWYQVWVGQGYTASNDFVPLRHLWSLAVEEQFYLVWPLVMMLLLRRGGTRRLAMTARWLVIAALAITVAVAVLHHGGTIGECSVTPDAYWSLGGRCIAKADALYLSTITRASGLLLGAAFAMVWRPRAIMRSALRERSGLLDVVALAGLAILAAMCWFVHVVTPAGADPWLFRGGFLVTDVATLALIAAVTHRRTLTGRVLGARPLVWAGTRSYGLYLYHWPIYQIIRKVAGNSLTLTQFAIAMVTTAALTEASYRFVETPIRRRQFGAAWESLGRRRNPFPRQVVGITVVASLLLLSFGVIRLGLAHVQANEVEQSIAEGEKSALTVDDILGTNRAEAAPPATDAPTPATTVAPLDGVAGGTTLPIETTTTTSTTTTTTTLPSGPINYLAIGDSVMLGAAGVLTERGYTVLAEKNRQMEQIVPVVAELASRGVFDDPKEVVIIHLGTNGPIEAATLDDLLAPLSSVPNVLLLTVRADRAWTANNNAIIRGRDKPNDNIKLIDWEVESQRCTGNCFAADGIHLSADGQVFYANLIGDFTGK